MGDRFDSLRSLVRRAGERAKETVREQPFVQAIRRMQSEIGARRLTIPERELARAALSLPGLRSASVRADEGAIRLDLEAEDGRTVRARLVPTQPRFAPHGAKEIVFLVVPEEAAGEPLVRAYVASLGQLIARALWGAMAPQLATERDASSAVTDRERDELRIDLRTLPLVRAIAQTPAGGALLDALAVESLEAQGGNLVARISMGLFSR
ncbi:MAG: hypothetical protein U0234_02325 [Sandaracinus sp.]